MWRLLPSLALALAAEVVEAQPARPVDSVRLERRRQDSVFWTRRMTPRERELFLECTSPSQREWPAQRDSGEVALLGRLRAGREWRDRGPADTGRFAADSARVVSVERWADDAPRWARDVVQRDGGRLLVVRERPVNPECDPRPTEYLWRLADADGPPAGTQAVFEVRLVADTLAGRPRVLGVVGMNARWAWWPDARPGQLPFVDDRSAPRPTLARWLAWWPVLGALGDGRQPHGSERDTTIVGDTVVARRVVAWSERHRDSATAEPVLGVVMRARRLLESHAQLALRSPLEGRWQGSVTFPDGERIVLGLHADMSRDVDGVPRFARGAEPVVAATPRPGGDAREGVSATHPLGPPGWRPDTSPVAYALVLTTGERRCAGLGFARLHPTCFTTRGALEHDAEPVYADADSIVYPAAIELAMVPPVFAQYRAVFEALGRLSWDQQMVLAGDRLKANERVPRALHFSTRQGRCVVVRRTGEARCRYRGLSELVGEILEYDLRRSPTPEER